MATDIEQFSLPRADAEPLHKDRFRQRKQSSSKFYNSTRWRKLRASLLRRRRVTDEPRALEIYHREGSEVTLAHYNYWLHSGKPLCQACAALGFIEPGNTLDHIQPITRGGAPFDPQNLQFLSSRCHNAKSASEASSQPTTTTTDERQQQ